MKKNSRDELTLLETFQLIRKAYTIRGEKVYIILEHCEHYDAADSSLRPVYRATIRRNSSVGNIIYQTAPEENPNLVKVELLSWSTREFNFKKTYTSDS